METTKSVQSISDAVDQDGKHDSEGRCLHVGVSRYQAALDDPMLNVEQKREFLETMWLVLTTFAELGYSIQPEDECQQDNAASPQYSRSIFDQALDKLAACS